MKSRFDLVSVGLPHPHAKDIPNQEGFHAVINRSSGIQFVGGWRGVSAADNKAIRFNPIDVALAERGGALFILVKIPNLIQDWMDMPFDIGLVPEAEERELNPRGPDEGRLLTILLLDMPSKVVASMRAATLSPAFCDVLEASMARQAAVADNSTPERHARAVQEAYAHWPRPGDMVRDAIIVERIGMPFHKESAEPGVS